MIILEGPDGSGKTTLAAKLAKALRLPNSAVQHIGPPPMTPMTAPSGAWQQYTEVAGLYGDIPAFAVMDRFIYGEHVYGPIFRNDSRFTIVHQRLLERILFNYRTVVVYCRPPRVVSKQNWSVRRAQGKEMITDESVYDQICDGFDKVMTETHLPVIRFDPFSDSFDDLISSIEAMSPNPNVGNGHGNLSSASTLIVGDFLVAPDIQDFSWPGIAYDGPFYRLAEQLQQAGIPERNMYWMNAVAPGKRGQVVRNTSLLREHTFKSIIAVGDAGKEWCSAANVTPDAVLESVTAWFAKHPFSEHPLIWEMTHRA